MSGNTQLVPHIDTQTRLNRSFLFEKEVIASIEKKKKIDQRKISFLFPDLIRFKKTQFFLLEPREHTGVGRENKHGPAYLSSDVPPVWASEETSFERLWHEKGHA